MGYATHRIAANAPYNARSLRPSELAQRAWAPPPANNFASAALVLGNAMDFAHAANGAAGAPTPADEGFDAAVRLYAAGHWEQAFVNLATLADQGHAVAAKLALLMLRYGATVYGSTFTVHPGQVARWAQRVLRTGSRATSRATASPSSMTAIA